MQDSKVARKKVLNAQEREELLLAGWYDHFEVQWAKAGRDSDRGG